MHNNIKQQMVGRKVTKIFMNTDFLRFETDKGPVVFGVDGDCCSTSRFYDFYGVKNLLNNGAITEVAKVDITPKTGDKDQGAIDIGETSVYGYQLTTESPEFGQVTSVFSFRNYSNGYYGGSLTHEDADKLVSPEITDDVIDLKAN